MWGTTICLLVCFVGSGVGKTTMLYVAQIIVYEPEEKTEESLCGLLRVATPGWTDNIFSRCKLVEVSDEVVRFSVQMDEDNLPPTIRGLEGEELLLNVAQLLHGDRNACRISTGFAKDTSEVVQTNMFVSTVESEDICAMVKGKSYFGTTVHDCQISSIVFAMDQAFLRTYRLVLSPDATWWRTMQVLRALNGFVGRCRYNGHPTN
ncbi:hypothetical protein CSKR_113734 [Clonorchis sinensis]|uniref:Uncharacterized protein n=1 Tax=Clonorchis sinensis TaxID=79923 RepID=A0A419Q7B2_CLOSI|nr:hypothetical protein CSKR_113734 [Clonorchis sinensis]